MDIIETNRRREEAERIQAAENRQWQPTYSPIFIDDIIFNGIDINTVDSDDVGDVENEVGELEHDLDEDTFKEVYVRFGGRSGAVYIVNIGGGANLVVTIAPVARILTMSVILNIKLINEDWDPSLLDWTAAQNLSVAASTSSRIDFTTTRLRNTNLNENVDITLSNSFNNFLFFPIPLNIFGIGLSVIGEVEGIATPDDDLFKGRKVSGAVTIQGTFDPDTILSGVSTFGVAL